MSRSVDNGTGIPLAVRNGVGLTGMRERFKELGGRLMVRSALPGTMLFASLPLPSRIKAVGIWPFIPEDVGDALSKGPEARK